MVKPMLLGGTIAGQWRTPEEWEALLVKSRFKAVTAPFDCRTEKSEVSAYRMPFQYDKIYGVTANNCAVLGNGTTIYLLNLE